MDSWKAAREIVKFAIGGGWGSDGAGEGLMQVGVIRGADFPNVQVDNLSEIPVRFEAISKVATRQLQAEDIVLEISGGTDDRPTGRSIFVSETLLTQATEPLIPASFCRLIRLRDDLVSPRYVYYWLQQMHRAGRAWEYQVRSTGIANFQFEYFLDTEKVRLPALDDQRRIAEVLGAIDDKVTSNRRAAEKAARILDTLADSAQGTALLLGEIADVSRQAANPKAFGEQEVDHFSIPAFDDGKRPERCRATSIASGKFLVSDPAVLVSRINPRFSRLWYAVPRPGTPALCSTEFMVLRPVFGRTLADVWLSCSQRGFRAEMVQRITGTSGSHQRVRPADVLAIEVVDPGCLTEGMRTETLRLLDFIERMRRQQAALIALRDSLLPELLLGRLRAPKFDDPPEVVP